MDNKQKDLKLYIFTAAGLVVLIILQFVLHRVTPFIKDDLWYATNIATGGDLTSPVDIIESQFWHYFNWGGRVINHALLQSVIATGELGADILNILATLILGFMICLVAGVKNPLFYLLSEALIVSFNASIHFSMYWEAGSVNYLYSTSWILLYVFFILRSLDENKEKIKAIEIFIIPLALIAGWSTENMGPTCFVLTVFVIIYKFIRKEKVYTYLYEGAFLTLLGSALLILAPGNFVRNQFVEKTTLSQLIHNRIDNFLLSSCDFLFPTLLFAFSAFVIEIFVLKKISVRNVSLFAFALIAQAAMFLSPAYPQRASFGIMCVLIAYIITVLNRMNTDSKPSKTVLVLFTVSVYIHALITVCRDLIFIPF
ncbi:MAG: DUF6056 family protein [Lachnospiraceae bacterium]|nr:DUF6056 family protein [Lachnospiraceae bacterium]